MMTTNQLAEASNLAQQTILNYVKEGYIKPDHVTPDGRYYFNESMVNTLFLRKYCNHLRNAVLLIVFGNSEEELNLFESRYIMAQKQTGMLRVDDIYEYMDNVKQEMKNDECCMRRLLKIFFEKAIGEYEKACEKAQAKIRSKAAADNRIKEMSLLLQGMNEFFMEGCTTTDIDDRDEEIMEHYTSDYCENLDNLDARYDIERIKFLKEKLESGEEVSYQPTTPKLRSLWEKAERLYFRTRTDKRILEDLSEGYCSLLKIVADSKDAIYQILRRGLSNEYKEIFVYHLDKATAKEQEVIRYLQDTKNVIEK